MGLYSRFGGKDGVIDELYAEGFERLVDGMKANVPTDDPVADLRRGATCYRDTAIANSTHYMVMFGGAVPDFVPSDASHELAHAAFNGLVAKVARCTEAGVLEGSPDQIAELLWGSIHGLVMLEIVGINPLMSDPAARFERALRPVVPRDAGVVLEAQNLIPDLRPVRGIKFRQAIESGVIHR